MFTLDQIRDAHSKVKSGADFPRYVQDIIKLGVTGYDLFVNDGHAVYFGEGGFEIASAPKYDALTIAGSVNKDAFTERLKAHQRGETDYLTFCNDCAANGIEKWALDLPAMTCTYYDAAGNNILKEQIPRIAQNGKAPELVVKALFKYSDIELTKPVDYLSGYIAA